MKIIKALFEPSIYDPNDMSSKGLRAAYKVIDDKNKERGTLMLSELEAGVLSSQLAAGDLMVAKFQLVKG